MASAGGANDRNPPEGWNGSASLSSLHSGLSHGHSSGRGVSKRPIAGSLSTPTLGAPPPGFNSGNDDSRNNTIWGSKGTVNTNGNPMDGMDGHRSSSFNNLAAVFGSGLAESINDAVLTDTFFSPEKKQGQPDLNYARQSRQTALRMGRAGESSIGSSHKAPEAPNMYPSFEPSNHRSGSMPMYGGAGAGARGPPGRDDYSRDQQNQSVGGLYADQGYGTAFGGRDNRNAHQGGYMMKDLGTTVTEPQESRGGPRSDDADLQRGMKNLWSSDNDKTPKTGGAPKDAREVQRQSEDELRPFAWDVRHHEPSRALVIMRASTLVAADVRATCELFGVIDAFRSDFADRGVFFVSYYDMRCAQYAAAELLLKLQPPAANEDKILVQFSVPLNSSSQFDDSLVVLNDVPMDMNIESLAQMLSSYGAVRSLRSLGGNYGGTSFVAEYHDVQDAKQAVLELESTQPWGPNVSVEVGARNPSDRKRGRELLALIGRWRHGESSPDASRRHPTSHGGPGSRGSGGGRYGGHYEQPHTNYIPGSHAPRHDMRYDRSGGPDR
ncbi:MAG: hypothetical protein SGBAC_012747, partial [Bacillariaceae sp.]